MAGLDAVDAGVKPEQAVAVGLGNLVVVEFLERVILGVFFREVAQQRHRQPGKITGCRVMLRVGHAGGVAETAAGHAEALGFLIHLLGKIFLAAGHGFSQRHGSVITRLDDHAFDQVFHRNLRIDPEEHARTLRSPGFF